MADLSSHPIPRSPRYESLDLWRGAACLMIVVVHSQGFRLATFPATASSQALAGQIGWHGVILNKVLKLLDVGVPIFFVISGYCIAATCDSSRRKSQSFGEFYTRRFRRIFPPYWIYLLLLGLIFAALRLFNLPRSALVAPGVDIAPPWGCGFWSLFGSICLTSTWQDRLVGSGGMISGQSWSLCYEEQFYLVAGLLLWWSPRRLYLGVSVVAAVVLVLFLAAPKLGLDLHGFFFDGFWLLFSAGFLVFFRLNHASGRSKWAVDVVLLSALLILSLMPIESRWVSRHFYLVGISFAMLLIWLKPWDLMIANSPLSRPLVFCGRMCYSLYLIHYPIAAIVASQTYEAGLRGFWQTVLITVPLSLMLSVAAAYLFHLFVERRFLNPPNILSTRTTLEAAPG